MKNVSEDFAILICQGELNRCDGGETKILCSSTRQRPDSGVLCQAVRRQNEEIKINEPKSRASIKQRWGY